MIQEAISELTRGKTIITIAHRLATSENADQILVVELLKSVETAEIENFQPSMEEFSISGGGTGNIFSALQTDRWQLMESIIN